MRTSLGLVSYLIFLVNVALSAQDKPQRIVTEAEKLSAKAHVAVAIAAEPQEGVIRRYSALSSCVADTDRQYFQSSASYSTDICHDLNPHLTRGIVIASPAICANGKRAEVVIFTNSFCLETGGAAIPATPLIVSDDLLRTCIDVDKKWSFAFVCDGVEVLETGDLDPAIKMFAVIALVTLLGLGLGTAVLCCGTSVVIVGGLGLLSWGFWTLGRMCLGIYKVPDEDLPEEKPEEKTVEVE